MGTSSRFVGGEGRGYGAVRTGDLEPGVVYEQKARLPADGARCGILVFRSHDPLIAACRISEAVPESYSTVEESVAKAGGDAG